MLHQRLNEIRSAQTAPLLREMLVQQKKRNALVMVIALAGWVLAVIYLVFTHFLQKIRSSINSVASAL